MVALEREKKNNSNEQRKAKLLALMQWPWGGVELRPQCHLRQEGPCLQQSLWPKSWGVRISADGTHPNLILTSKPSFFTSWLPVLDVAHLMTWNVTHGHHGMLCCSRCPRNTSLPMALGKK